MPTLALAKNALSVIRDPIALHRQILLPKVDVVLVKEPNTQIASSVPRDSLPPGRVRPTAPSVPQEPTRQSGALRGACLACLDHTLRAPRRLLVYPALLAPFSPMLVSPSAFSALLAPFPPLQAPLHARPAPVAPAPSLLVVSSAHRAKWL